MTITIVNSSAGLVSALNAAHAGDVIQLAAGNYSAVAISGVKFDGVVTVTSQDPGAMAVLNGMTVKDSQGLAFKGLDMNVLSTGPEYGYQVQGSNNVTFDGVKVHGSLDGNDSNDASGLQIRSSTNVTVSNSEFQQLNNGISHLNSSGLTITKNYVHEMSEDGVRGGGSSNVVVSNNYFTDFHRRSETDHPDAIQFWTTNTTTSASNITVTGNVVARGDGDPIQGVFLRDQVGTLPYHNVTITNNLVVGGLRIGIGVYGGDHVNVADNTVAGLPDQMSQIATSGLVNSTLSNNIGTSYNVTSGVETGDKTIASPTDGGAAIQHDWLAANGRLTLDTTQSFSIQSTSSLSLQTTTTSLAVVNGANITSAQLDAAASKAVAAIDAERALAVHLNGTAGDDKLATDGVHDTIIDAGAGNDVLISGEGVAHDTLIGGLGDDKYTIRSENDQVVEDAGGGNDLVTSYVDYTLTDNVEQLRLAGDAHYGAGNALANKINGGVGDDELYGLGGDDQLSGGADGNDKLYGGDGADVLNGNLGNDSLSGDAGDDKLNGDEGSDSLAGGLGNDTLEGGAANDTLSGGAGADMFTFRDGDLSTTGDTIVDFSHAQGDRINLVAIDANTGLTGDQKFAFIGTSAFHKVAGELRFEISGGVTHVYGDVNGDGVSDIHLVMPGAGTLVSADFML